MARLVLTDASLLVGLARVDGVAWLRDLFGEVEMTFAVRRELEAGTLEPGIIAAFDEGWLRTRKHDDSIVAGRPPHLGQGEWSTIAAARKHKGPVLLLLDDRLARREARAVELSFVGTAALVGLAQRRGLIASARDVFEQLLQTGFRIAPEVIRTVLEELE